METIGLTAGFLGMVDLIWGTLRPISASKERRAAEIALNAEIARLDSLIGFQPDDLGALIRPRSANLAFLQVPGVQTPRDIENFVTTRLANLREILAQFDSPKKQTRPRLYQNFHRWNKVRRRVATDLQLCKQLNDALDSLRQPIMMIWTTQRATQGLEARLAGLEDRLETLQHAWNPFSGYDPPLSGFKSKAHNSVVSNGAKNVALIKELYECAMKGLFIIGKLLSSQDFLQAYERLKIWGTGLFSGPLGLISVLTICPDHTGERGPDLSCGVFQSAFINILLDIERVFIVRKAGEIENPTVLAFQNELANLLEADGPLRNEIYYQTLLRDPRGEAALEEDINQSSLHRIGIEVQNLFVGLRTVDSLRDLMHHRLQNQLAGQASTPEKPATSVPVGQIRQKSETSIASFDEKRLEHKTSTAVDQERQKTIVKSAGPDEDSGPLVKGRRTPEKIGSERGWLSDLHLNRGQSEGKRQV